MTRTFAQSSSRTHNMSLRSTGYVGGSRSPPTVCVTRPPLPESRSWYAELRWRVQEGHRYRQSGTDRVSAASVTQSAHTAVLPVHRCTCGTWNSRTFTVHCHSNQRCRQTAGTQSIPAITSRHRRIHDQRFRFHQCRQCRQSTVCSSHTDCVSGVALTWDTTPLLARRSSSYVAVT